MDKKILYIFFILILILSFSNLEAQRWKKYRYEYSYGLGATNFMGDVGAPAENFITQYFWINPHFFRPIANFGLGYFFTERIMEKANLHIGWLSANDKYGAWDSRHLKFNSMMFELSFETEIYIVKEKRKANIYRNTQRFKRKIKNINIPTYLFVGFGAAFVNTNLEFNENINNNLGSSAILGKKATFTPTIPIGIGFRYKMTNRIYLGLEASLRYTVTDKIDNLTPTLGTWVDAYQFLVFSLNYKIKTARNGLPRFKMSY